MRRYMILLGLTVLLTASIRLSSSEKETIKLLPKMHEASATMKTGNLNKKTTLYNNSYTAGSGNYFLIDVKMPINSMILQKNDGC